MSEKNNEFSIEVTSIEDHEDGSATMVLDMSKQAMDVFFRQGLRVMLEEMGKKMVILPPHPEFVKDGIKSIELEPDVFNAAMQVGLLSAFREAIDTLDKKGVEALMGGGSEGSQKS